MNLSFFVDATVDEFWAWLDEHRKDENIGLQLHASGIVRDGKDTRRAVLLLSHFGLPVDSFRCKLLRLSSNRTEVNLVAARGAHPRSHELIRAIGRTWKGSAESILMSIDEPTIDRIDAKSTSELSGMLSIPKDWPTTRPID